MRVYRQPQHPSALQWWQACSTQSSLAYRAAHHIWSEVHVTHDQYARMHTRTWTRTPCVSRGRAPVASCMLLTTAAPHRACRAAGRHTIQPSLPRPARVQATASNSMMAGGCGAWASPRWCSAAAAAHGPCRSCNSTTRPPAGQARHVLPHTSPLPLASWPLGHPTHPPHPALPLPAGAVATTIPTTRHPRCPCPQPPGRRASRVRCGLPARHTNKVSLRRLLPHHQPPPRTHQHQHTSVVQRQVQKGNALPIMPSAHRWR